MPISTGSFPGATRWLNCFAPPPVAAVNSRPPAPANQSAYRSAIAMIARNAAGRSLPRKLGFRRMRLRSAATIRSMSISATAEIAQTSISVRSAPRRSGITPVRITNYLPSLSALSRTTTFPHRITRYGRSASTPGLPSTATLSSIMTEAGALAMRRTAAYDARERKSLCKSRQS